MNKKFISSLILLGAISLTSCASSTNYIYDAEVIKNDVVSKFTTPESTLDRVHFEGVTNIFNREGYEYRKTNYAFTGEKLKAHYLANIPAVVNMNTWFNYKGEVKTDEIYLGDEFNVIFEGETKYVLTSISGSGDFVFSSYEESIPSSALTFVLYQGIGAENAVALLEKESETFLAVSEDKKAYFTEELTEGSSWMIGKEQVEEVTNFVVRNVSLPDEILMFNPTYETLEFSDTATTSNLKFYVTVSDGKKKVDPKTVYGALSQLFIIRGSFAKIAMEAVEEDVVVTRPASIDPNLGSEYAKENITLDVDGGLHLIIKNASCMISLTNCHYVDGWTDVSSTWARWNLEMYFNSQGLLVFEKISTNNYSSSTLKESIFCQGIYTYAHKI